MHVAFVSALYAYGTEPGSSPSPLMPVTIASCGLLSQRLDAGTRPMLAHLSLTPATSFLQSGKEERCPLFPARTKSRFPILRADALQDDRASGTIAAPVGRFPRPASGWAIPLGFFFLPPSLPLVRPSSGSRSQVLPLREIKGRKDKLMTIYTDTARYDTGRAMTELRRAAPSIFATTTHESRSERFQPIPTIDVLRGLMKEGFVPVGAKQSSIFGQINRPFSSRRVKRQAAKPSCQMIFKIFDLRPLKTKRCPDKGSCFRTSCTRSAREGNPQRMSVCPVESQTLTPVPIGNGFTAMSPAHA